VARTEWTLQATWPPQTWWSDPELVITAFATDMPYGVSVELRRDEEGVWFASGIACRRHRWADGWKGERRGVSPREVQRLPLAKIIRAALAAAPSAVRPDDLDDPNSTPFPQFQLVYDPGDDPRWSESGPGWAVDARKVLLPRGRPQHGKSVDFYTQLAVAYRDFASAGLSPVKEIARRKKVSENTVHQWILRTRRLGFLEPSPRSRPRSDEDAS